MNSADEDAILRAESADEMRRLSAEHAWQSVLNEKLGREVIWQILEWAGCFQVSYVKGDSHETAFREGMRNIGLRVMDAIDPDTLRKMQAEAAHREDNFRAADSE